MPATSSNVSARVSAHSLLISESGIDKERFESTNFVRTAIDGSVAPGETRRPSAEMMLHAAIYRTVEAGVVLHTHSSTATACSRLFATRTSIVLEGYELLKAFPNVHSHDVRVEVPIIDNSQNMLELSQRVASNLSAPQMGAACPAFLLSGHGVYAWGQTLADAKRHLEALESLLECELKLAHARPG